MTTEKRDPARIGVHPSLKQIPEWHAEDARYEAFVRDVRDRGLQDPLLIDKEGRVVDIDSRLRLRAAQQLGFEAVDCRIVPQDQVLATMLAFLYRPHFTKGQRAYLSFPLLKDAYDELIKRRVARAQTGQRGPASTEKTQVATVEDFAHSLGFSRPLFYQAKTIHKHFERATKFEWNDAEGDLTLKEYYEPRILDDDDPVGLGAVIAGIGAKLSGATLDQHKAHQLELFINGFSTFMHRLLGSREHWTKAREQIREAIADLPTEDREAAAAIFAEITKELKTAKEAR